jgi:hypothetical protein
MLHIHQVRPGDRAGVNDFIEFPHRLYSKDPNWVPAMRSDMERTLDPDQHPFYRSGQAAFFLAAREGEVLGRIAAIENQRYNQVNGTRTGFFTYFECVDDPGVSRALFEAAFSWMRRLHLELVIGPKGLLPGDGNGLLIRGFRHFPAMGIAYNPDYYQALVEAAGFHKATDYYSGYLTSSYRLPERFHRVVEQVKERHGYHVKRFRTKEELRRLVPELRDVYNASFRGSFSGPIGFVPLTDEEIQLIAKRLLSLAQPDLIKLVFQRDQLIGFLFAYPNIGRAIRRARGRVWPLGWLHMMMGLRTTRSLDVNGIGILPEHQGRGANGVLYVELEKTIKGTRFEHADMVQVREENMKSLAEAEALGVNWYKTHRLYRHEL